jgi:hypothetical protein
MTVLSSSIASGYGIRTYADLKQKVGEWLNRTSLSDVIPDFVQLAETAIRRDVKTRAQEQLATGTSDASNTFPVPADFISARRLAFGSHRKDYVSPVVYTDKLARCSQDDDYTIIGQTVYVLGVAGAYVLLYWQAFPPFYADPDTNWLLTNAPEVYLWAACEKGALYLKDYDAAADFGARYAKAVSEINAAEEDARFSGAPLVLPVDGPTP